MGNENVVHLHSGILFSYYKKMKIWNSQVNHLKGGNPGPETHHLFFSYMNGDFESLVKYV